MSLPFIGSRISLISKSNIRFVGTLHAINQEESSISLENVQSFGTEGRVDPQSEIPPSPQIFPLIVFKGSDVMDLNVINAPAEFPPQSQQVDQYYQQQDPYYAQQQMYMQQQYYAQQQFQNQGYPPTIHPMHMRPPPQKMPMPVGVPGMHPPAHPGQQLKGSPPSAPFRPPADIVQQKPQGTQQQKPQQAPQAQQPLATPQVPQTPQKSPPQKKSQNISDEQRETPKKQSEQKKPVAQQGALKVSDPILSHDKKERSKPASANEQKGDKPRDSSILYKIDKGKQRPEKSQEKLDRSENQGFDKVEKPEKKEWTDKGDKNNKGRRKERPSVNLPKEEYDFESANAKFVREDQEVDQASPAYVKSSFFDDISSDIKDRFQRQNSDFDRREQHKQDKNLNMETFGQAAPRHHNRRGRGRGRGRGGSGRGRGRGGAGHESHAGGNTA